MSSIAASAGNQAGTSFDIKKLQEYSNVASKFGLGAGGPDFDSFEHIKVNILNILLILGTILALWSTESRFKYVNQTFILL